VVPNLIGVDIGCGVLGINLGKLKNLDYSVLDNFIRKNIPASFSVRDSIHPDWSGLFEEIESLDAASFRDSIKGICKEEGQDYERVMRSLGSLGGGNHFIELDQDSRDNLWLLVHSGSRNFGLRIAEYYQKRAREICGKMDQLEYLTGKEMQAYISDMRTAQSYARLNRRLILQEILKGFIKVQGSGLPVIESVHNYIDFSDSIIRKGAISAKKDESVIIPLSMADGTILGLGKGNRDWNYSAPHGAGRRLSRTQAKASINLNEFRNRMEGIFTTSIGSKTLDEAPQAYKDPEEIIDSLEPTVEIEERLFPVYNFKAPG